MAGQTVSFVAVAVFIVGGCLAEQIPDNVKVCQRNSEKCFANAIMDLLPRLKGGMPAMGIPPLDPIHIPSITVDSGTGGSFQFDIRGKEVDFTGMTNMKVRKAKMDVEKNLFTLEFQVPNVNATGHYKSKGKLLTIDIDGEGEMFFFYRNLMLKAEWEGTRNTREGKEYYTFKAKKFHLTVEKGSYGNFGNLFKDNPELTDSTNKIFNEHFVVAFEEFAPSLDLALSKLTTAVINSIHDKFPIDTLYPA